jgi:CHASE2 domain-containing sensor protein
VRALALGLAVSIAVTVLSRIGVFAGWETRAVDAFVFLRERQPAPEIALVAIDEDAFESLGDRQPLPRDYVAQLIDILLRSGARVVAVDPVMKAPTTEAADAALISVSERAAGSEGRLVFAAIARPHPGPDEERFEMSPPFSPALRAGASASRTRRSAAMESSGGWRPCCRRWTEATCRHSR